MDHILYHRWYQWGLHQYLHILLSPQELEVELESLTPEYYFLPYKMYKVFKLNLEKITLFGVVFEINLRLENSTKYFQFP